MELTELQQLYAKHPHTKALGHVLDDSTVRIVHLKGLLASAAPLVFSGVQGGHTLFYVLDDQEQAGYFYHDLMQILDEEKVLFLTAQSKQFGIQEMQFS